MSISLQALETALSAIEEIGKEELTFPLGSTTVTLRVLLPEDEIAIQRFAAEAIASEDVGDDQAAIVEYLDRFKVETIARALAAVGDQRFADAEYIETGELLDNGKPVKVPRIDAMRKLIGRWNGQMRTAIFKKYTELLRKVESITDNAVEFEPSDDDAEIERLKSRIKELKARKLAEQPTSPMDHVDAVATLGAADQADRKEALNRFAPEGTQEVLRAAPEDPPADQVEQVEQETIVEPPAQPSPRTPLVPRHAPPPVATPQQPEQKQMPSHTQPNDGGSLVDGLDMQAAAEAEHRRLAAARQRRMQQAAEAAQGALRPDPTELPPPHVRAAQAAVTVEDEEALVREQAKAVQLGETEGGVPVFSMPSSDLSRPDERQARRQVPVNQKNAGAGTINPRFRPPKAH